VRGGRGPRINSIEMEKVMKNHTIDSVGKNSLPLGTGITRRDGGTDEQSYFRGSENMG
jgi:hypothetical protein